MVPAQKIVKFSMGKGGDYNNKKLPLVLTVINAEKVQVQVRHNAMEACRQVLNKTLNEELNGQFFLKVVPFPHHIQRENRMLTGAGADRLSSGMQLSFGKAIAKAALLKKEAPLFIIAVSSQKGIRVARAALKEIKSKLPFKFRIDFKDLTKENKQEVKKEPKKE